LPTSSINWKDKTDIDITVNIPTNALVADVLLLHIQTGGNNILIPHVQTEESNLSMSYSQDINTSTMIPDIESIAISYGDNQPADPNLWDGSFFPTFIFGINESLGKDSKNIVLLLQRIGTFIQQCSIKSSSKTSVPLNYKSVIVLI